MAQIPIESMNLMLLNVGRAQHNADWNWQDVSSPFSRIYYVIEGEALLHLPGQDIKLCPRRMYIIPAYTVHSYECHGVFVHYYLHVYEGFKNEMNIQEVYELPTEVDGSKTAEHLFEFLCEQLPNARLPHSNPNTYDTSAQTSGYVQRYLDMALWEKMELRGAMLMIMSHFIHHATPRIWTKDERMKHVLEYIHSHISESIDVDTLASIGCVTKSYLIKLFKRDFGTSPIQYINKKKVERAQLLLFTTDKAVKEIAYMLGFSDQNYFVRLFRKVTDITPQEYRRRAWAKA
ncbi:MAG: helix-turn-helix transcriptional regulator [Bacteroidaceae bacterium]|nr:helix-turn-helix transcriptional regulator [Bacteroidaceae bacterium]